LVWFDHTIIAKLPQCALFWILIHHGRLIPQYILVIGRSVTHHDKTMTLFEGEEKHRTGEKQE
jgi:hypothetical protein